MGLIRTFASSVKDIVGEQWLEYFYCDALPPDVIAALGKKKSTGKANTKGADNIINNGSIIAVAPGQCMIIVEQGKAVDICAEPGEYKYDMSTEPSIFYGDLGEQLWETMMNIGKRVAFGGEAPKDQRVYYFNTKEITGNKYGTPNPVPFRIVDDNIGLDADIAIKCFGEYSFRITDPILFFTNVCGNFTNDYTKYQLESQMKSELLTALQPAFGRISGMGVRYSEIVTHTGELAKAVDEELSQKWHKIRGMKIVSIGISSIKAREQDEAIIKELQRTAVFKDPRMAAAHLTDAQAEAIQKAAANEKTGAAMAFMGMGMTNMTANGINAQELYSMGTGKNGAEPICSGTWTCNCGMSGNTGKFCSECGAPRPVREGWTCTRCSTLNRGKFCTECGAKKPAGALQYRCDKCGWEPKDPTKPPKFCPECGDPFGDEDVVR